MATEIEAKLKVDSLEAVERKLEACDASFQRETVQTDCYFDTDDGEFVRSDRALRLRSDRTGDRERFVVTYKGPKEADDYKKRVEIEFGVSHADAADAFLQALGYRRALRFNKRRRLWELGGCEVALDELPLLGVFVEIEGPDSATIAGVQKMLDLTNAPPITDSYATLIDEQLSRSGRNEREVYL